MTAPVARKRTRTSSNPAHSPIDPVVPASDPAALERATRAHEPTSTDPKRVALAAAPIRVAHSDYRRIVVEHVPLDSLIAGNRALRRAGKRQQEALQRNIRRFGVVRPILIRRSGTIIAGHSIVEAARALDMPDVPVTYVDDLSDDEARVLRLSLHKIEEMATWDPEALKVELTYVLDTDPDLAVFTGFSTSEIDLTTAFRNAAEHALDGSLALYFMDWRHTYEIMVAAREVYASFKNLIPWVKSNAGMGSLWRSQHELIFAFKVGSAPHVNNVELGRNGRWRSNVWQYAGANAFGRMRDEDLAGHVTPKSVALLHDAILDVTQRGDAVLDPFAGAGSTLVAAHRARRVGYGVEIDPVYADTAVRRLEAFTRAEAVLESTGRTFAQTRAERSGASATA